MAELTYGLKDGELIHISEVERGKNCGCTCPHCNGELVARKGDVRENHFSHLSGADCGYGQETALHILAKEILLEAKKMTIPEVYVDVPNSRRKKEIIAPAQEIMIEKVNLETRMRDIIPDVVVTAGGKQFLVEIYVKHRIDTTKLKKIERLGISTIEIDLSKENLKLSKETLEGILLNDDKRKKWKYNAFAEAKLKELNQVNACVHSNEQKDYTKHKRYSKMSSRRFFEQRETGNCPICQQRIIRIKKNGNILCRCSRFPVCDYEFSE